MRVMILGAKGQLGSDLVRALADWEVLPLTRADLDLCDFDRTRAAVAGCIHAARHAAEDDQASGCKIARQTLSHAGAVRSRMPCADDGNAWERQRRDVSAHIEYEWRIVDLA